MSAFAAPLNWVGRHRLPTVLIVLAALLALSAAVAVPLAKGAEVRRIQAVVESSSAQLAEALQNESIFSGQPEESAAKLAVTATELSHLHDEAVLMEVHFAKGAQRTAVSYTEFTARVGAKLAQVAQARRRAAEAIDVYERSVAVLKTSPLATRVDAQEDVNKTVTDARNLTELAYQECVLLSTLTGDYGVAKMQALQSFDSIGPDVSARISALKPELQKAILDAHNLRKPFNPAAHAPGG